MTGDYVYLSHPYRPIDISVVNLGVYAGGVYHEYAADQFVSEGSLDLLAALAFQYKPDPTFPRHNCGSCAKDCGNIHALCYCSSWEPITGMNQALSKYGGIKLTEELTTKEEEIEDQREDAHRAVWILWNAGFTSGAGVGIFTTCMTFAAIRIFLRPMFDEIMNGESTAMFLIIIALCAAILYTIQKAAIYYFHLCVDRAARKKMEDLEKVMP